MNELLEKILSTDVLTEETRTELSNAIQTLITEQVEAAKTEAEADVRTELTEQWINERDVLIEALDAQVNELMVAEFKELREDIERFRDLEVEYAEKIVESRKELAGQLDSDIHTLAEQLDEFIQVKMDASFAELNESIQEVRQNELGRRAFELFSREYQQSFVNKSDIEKQLAEAQTQIETVKAQLKEATNKINDTERSTKIDTLLSSLGGKQREIMETIMKSVPTEKLEEGFEMFLPRVLKETQQPAQEKRVLAESKTIVDDKSTLITGNTTEVLNEKTEKPVISKELATLMKLSGIAE